MLHQVLVEHLETFLDRARTEEHTLPLHVEKELRNYVECGVLGCGFVRIKCDRGKEERALAFSCKGRGFCPSCTGRRMKGTFWLSAVAHSIGQVLWRDDRLPKFECPKPA
ncbi:MAG: hypothetical protein GY854_21965, partial [Deltaproteobacteria bacterium]|nr:hypothetical protein [Deltaproteobacteria bacterium]